MKVDALGGWLLYKGLADQGLQLFVLRQAQEGNGFIQQEYI
ncbi:hypothetical protein QUF73_13530 [Cytobacillus sp. NJ13]|nr:hypothetical protein [Cytobacillus sp. NJ13]